VYDSLAHARLDGAIVNLAPAGAGRGTSASVTSDSSGRFAIGGVTPGVYIVGFFHPRLDSLGIEAPVRRVTVAAGGRVVANIAVPSAQTIRSAICKTNAAAGRTTGMLVGHVDDAVTGNVVPNAVVTAQWTSFAFVNGRMARSLPTTRATTSDNGWFAFCNLPSSATVDVQVTHGADSSGVVGIDLRPADVTMRTLYVAKATSVAVAAPDAATDTLAPPAQLFYRGPGRLTGVVRTSAGGPPVSDVELTVQGTGLTTMSNERGEFSLSQLPLGTQTLLARKVGFARGEIGVDLVGTEPAHAVMLLATAASVMDTVKVLASKVQAADNTGFLRRQTLGFGHYFDAQSVARIQPFETSDLLRRVPSVRIGESGNERTLLMPSPIAGMCEPSIFIDGAKTPGLTASDLDMLVPPGTIAGIEVYNSAGATPAEFQVGLGLCGAVIVWTRTGPRAPPPR
jgi:hypothetical protein